MKNNRTKILLSICILIVTGIIGVNYVLPKVLLKLSREIPNRMASGYGLRFDDMEVRTFDSLLLKGDFIFPFGRNYSEETSSHSVIVLHPIKENSQSVYPILRLLTKLDVNFITFDMRGHGRSEGHLYTIGVNETKDITNIIDYILSIHPNHSFGIYGRKNTGNIVLKALETEKRLQYGIIENYDLHPLETIEKMNYDDIFIKNGFLKNYFLDQTIQELDIEKKDCFVDFNNIKQPILLLKSENTKQELTILKQHLNSEVFEMYFDNNPVLKFKRFTPSGEYNVVKCLSDFIETYSEISIENAKEKYFIPLE